MSEPKHQIGVNYTVQEFLALYDGNYGFYRPDPRPQRPSPANWEEVDPVIQHACMSIAGTLRKMGITCDLFLSGSRSKGYWTENSDYDIVATIPRVAGLPQQVAQRCRPYKVDLRFWPQGDPPSTIKIHAPHSERV